MPDGHGLNALTGEFGDLFDKGVLDPVRVTRLSLEHAASVAALLLTTEAIVAEELIAQPGAIIAPGSVTSRRGWRGRPPRSSHRLRLPAASPVRCDRAGRCRWGSRRKRRCRPAPRSPYSACSTPALRSSVDEGEVVGVQPTAGPLPVAAGVLERALAGYVAP